MKATPVGVISRRFEIKPNKVDGILNYDIDNAYPQRILYTIAASGTGVACTNLLGDYKKGRGFADEKFSDLIVNSRGETADVVLDKISKDSARFRGNAFHINYNISGKVVEVQQIPFEHCRHCIPDDTGYVPKIAIYDDWDRKKSTRIRQQDIDKLNVFNPDTDVVKKQIELAGGIEKYKGQVYWFSEDGSEYPTAAGDAVLMDMESDALVSTFTWRTLKTGFIQQTVFIHKGKFESEDAREEFKRNIQGYQGADQSNQIILVEIEKEEQIPELKSFNVIINDKLFEATDNKVVNKIIRNYKQPLALHSIQQPGTLGLTREFQEAQTVYDMHVDSQRASLSAQFKRIFLNWKEKITQDFTIVPVSGLKKESDKQPLAISLGIGGVQALTAVISDATLQPQQKINILITVFSVPKAEAEAMINGTALPA